LIGKNVSDKINFDRLIGQKSINFGQKNFVNQKTFVSVKIFEFRSKFRSKILTNLLSVTIFGQIFWGIAETKYRSKFLKVGQNIGQKF